jgi:zinc D-Ala-D-Ala carboxypeptidase
MTQLTPYFSLEEFTDSQTAARRGIDNAPSAHALKNLQRTAETMEKVRAILDNHPILISSGYRNRWLNSAIGGSKNSAHMHGLAADFTCPGFGSPLSICQELEPMLQELQIDQLIWEFGTWVHLGLSADKPRHQALTIDKRGTRKGLTE